MTHWQRIKLCTSATVGDVGFALTPLWTTSLVARERHWMGNPTALPVLVFLGTVVALTVGFEFYYTQVIQRWTYSDFRSCRHSGRA